jgi:hypothetical protein
MKDKDSKGGDAPPRYETPTVIPITGESSDGPNSCEPTGAIDVSAGGWFEPSTHKPAPPDCKNGGFPSGGCVGGHGPGWANCDHGTNDGSRVRRRESGPLP